MQFLLLSGVTVLLSSFMVLIIKTFGIDFVIGLIKRTTKEN